MKKTLALLLAILMVIGSVLVVSAEEVPNYKIITEFYAADSNGDWVPVTSVAAGSDVKMRVSISTNFVSGPATLLLAYDKAVLSASGLSSNSSISMTLNEDFDFTKKIQQVSGADGTNVATKQLGLGNITQSQFDDYGFLAFSIRTNGCIVYDSSDWIFELDMTVLKGVGGKTLDCFVIPETVCTTENTQGFVAFPYAESTSSPLADLAAAYLWYENSPELESVQATVTPSPTERTVTWIAEGIEKVEYYEIGDTITGEWAPEKTGYTFIGWSPDVPDKMPEKNLIFTAQWDANEYTISFENTGDTVIEPVVQDYGTAIAKPENPVKTGYTFAGWQPEIPDTMPAENLTVTAQWDANEYTISFENTGDTVIEPVVQDYGTAIAKPENPVKTGYTFAGWQPEIPDTMPDENLILTAQWQVNQYKITFENTGDTVIEPVVQDYGTAVTKPENPVKAGYTFAGWQPEIPDMMPAENLTVTAQWDANEYTISFENTGDTVIEPVVQDYGTAIAKPENPVKTGYTFAGWQPEIPDTMPDENLILTAQWQVNQYKITFENTGDTVIDTVVQDYGTAIAKPENPVKTGYTFAGWQPEIPDMMPAEDLTISATWIANSYNAVFDANGGLFANNAEEITASFDFDSDIKASETPVKEGYVFAGWSETENGETVDSLGKMDNINGKKFYAIWLVADDVAYTVETYTMGTNGEHTLVTTAHEGTTGETATADYTISDGFRLNAEKSVLSGVIAADGSLVLKVYIDRNTYKFTTDIDGVKTSTDYLYGATVTAPATPSKAGYTFTGWSAQIPQTMPANDVTLVANFKCIATVKIKNNPGSRTIKYGEILCLTAETANAPEGAKIFWYVDGVKKGEGTTFEVSPTSGSDEVTVKLVDANGNDYADSGISDSQKVSVNAGFFQKIISFFKNLFGMNRTIVQRIFK